MCSSDLFDGVPVHLGAGEVSLGWAATASGVGLLALLALRIAVSADTMLGRGVGGLLVPLLVLGSIAGQLLGHVFNGNEVLLGTIGAATLLGAGYCVPLAALVWLAETTHSLPTVLLGAVVVLITQMVGGGRSVSTAQRVAPVRAAPEPTSPPGSDAA